MRGKKVENENYVNFILHAGNPQYVTKINRRRSNSSLRRWGGITMILGILVFVALAVGAFLVVTKYILPSAAPEPAVSAPAAPESEESALSEAEEASRIIKYDTKTGLPLYENEELLFLVNAKNPLGEENQPELTEFENIQVDRKITDALRAMVQKADEDNLVLKLKSGYVSDEEQQALYDQKVNELVTKEKYTKIMARAKAEAFVPKPGESDTQTGLCVTLDASKEAFAKSVTYTWLNKNAADYGFIFRYPEDKADNTGLEGDWRVLRYVGSENAKSMRQLAMCLEEYISYMGL